jgi:hypothetical protein
VRRRLGAPPPGAVAFRKFVVCRLDFKEIENEGRFTELRDAILCC